MRSDLFKLNFKDIINGVVTAVLTGVAFTVVKLTFSESFDVFTADWGFILKAAINSSYYAFIGYMLKNFLSDDSGRVLGLGK